MTRARSLATSAPLAYRDWHTATFPRRRYPPPLRRAPQPPAFHGAEDAARAVARALECLTTADGERIELSRALEPRPFSRRVQSPAFCLTIRNGESGDRTHKAQKAHSRSRGAPSPAVGLPLQNDKAPPGRGVSEASTKTDRYTPPSQRGDEDELE